MSSKRINTVALDFTNLAKRPEQSIIEDFMFDKLGLDMKQVSCIQYSNIHKVVYVKMTTKEAAESFAKNDQMYGIDGAPPNFRVSIYVDTGMVEVRLHDLPIELSNQTIMQYMLHYGQVLFIGNEKWPAQHRFAGAQTGVRLMKMRVDNPIPSYITVCNEPTYVSYPNQARTCRYCTLPLHTNLRCSEAKAKASQTTVTKPAHKELTAKTNTKQSTAETIEVRSNTQNQQQNKTPPRWGPSPQSSPDFRGFPDSPNHQNVTAEHTDRPQSKRQLSTESSEGVSSEAIEAVAEIRTAIKPQMKKKK